MNGRTHAVIGAASVSGAALIGVPAPQVAVLAAVAAGFALGPDIDHPGATISRTMPRLLHRTVLLASRSARAATATPGDHRYFTWRTSRGHDPDHRALTHTAAAGCAVTALVFAVASLPEGSTALAVLAAWWCHTLLPGRWLIFGVALVAVATHLAPPSPALIAWAAASGWASHLLCDACTRLGIPLLWPLCISGRRWRHVRLLGSVLRSGDAREWFPAIAVALVLNTPALFLR